MKKKTNKSNSKLKISQKDQKKILVMIKIVH